jgi:hypothetical protein
VLVAPSAHAEPDGPIADPLPDPVASRVGLTLTEFASFPKSEPVPPPTDSRLKRHARINFLSEIPDGSGRLAVPDLNGALYTVKKGTPQLYLDLKAQVGADFWSGRGLGSGFGFVAFHPEFRRNGRFYTVHTEAFSALETKKPDLPAQNNPSVQGVLTEWTADDPSAETFSGSRREMLRLAFRSYLHGYQEIGFNPTANRWDSDYGLLYLAVADGGAGVSSTDPQNLAMPQGKIFRIDPRGTNSGNGKYGIPKSNPFVGRPGALGEIYAYGLRNPHRFSWDPLPSVETGENGWPRLRHRMYVGNIGEANIESIYELEAGDNFGWTEREGPYVLKKGDPTCAVYPLPADDAKLGYTYPVAAYDHVRAPGSSPCRDSGDAVIGGFVYRDHRLPLLWGKYLFGDDVNGRMFYTNAHEMRRGGKLAPVHELTLFDPSGKQVTMQELAGHPRVDLRLGRDARGQLYVLSKANGKIWKVTGARLLPKLPDVHPRLKQSLAAYYDFEHPAFRNPAEEKDQGFSGTNLGLINGGPAMRVNDGAYPASATSLQIQQVNPTTAGNDDWKAGSYSPTGVPTLKAFNSAAGTTVMGWFKMTGQNPSPNSGSPNPDDFFGAIGLAGVLSGNSDGHAVRALLEVFKVNGELHLVALGRRIDGSSSHVFAAKEDWRTLLPQNEWVFLAATFDFDAGTMALYKNGKPIEGFYSTTGDPWGVEGPPEPDLTSPTDPRGIKIGGSFPQNTREANPCNCRMDSLMFLNRSVSAREVWLQYRHATTQRPG